MSVSKADRRLVLLLSAREELREPRRAPDEQHEHARRERVERPRVPDALLPEHTPHARHHVVRSPALRLVDDENAVHVPSILKQSFADLKTGG